MLKNFIVVALRNLKKNSLYSVINISGLSVGIACSMLILLWVKEETSFDKFIPKVDRLHQVWVNASIAGGDNGTSLSLLPFPLIKIIFGLPRTEATGSDINSVILIPDA